MLDTIHLQDILFLDIETVPASPDFENLDPDFKDFWEKKSGFFRKENETPADVYPRAGIYAEFGKVVCISAGFIFLRNGDKCFRLKSFYGENEKELLTAFIDMLNSSTSKRNLYLCAHNGKEFDFPYLARRILLNELKLPAVLDVAGKKPWEVAFLDTLELWKFGDYKHYTSLNLLAKLFRIQSPKEDMDGSQVFEVYYREKNLEKIVDYCEKDVLAVAQLFLKYRGESVILPEHVEHSSG